MDFLLDLNLENIEKRSLSNGFEPLQIKLSTSNLCNGMCVTCGSHLSSAWSQLENANIGYRGADFEQNKINWGEIVSLSFLGGEPFLEKKNFEILQKLVDLGNTDCFISIVTNGSITPNDQQINILSRFSKLNICLSIDGTDKSFEYMRFPLKWDQLLHNLSIFKSLGADLSVSCTISNLNIYYYSDMINFFKFNELNYLCKQVESPSIFIPGNLPDSVKSIVLDRNIDYKKEVESLWNVYGPTETTIWSLIAQIDFQSGLISIGHPLANTEVYILDLYLQPVPIGVPGELHIGGVGLARRYLNRPELTAERFIQNPFSDDKSARLYKTGDLARYLADGNIEYLGRSDNQVKIRGFRIELGEIEAVLSSHEQIQQAVVIAREDIPGNKRLVAYLVTNNVSLTSNQVRELLKQKLPEYMIPNAFVFLDSIPLTPNGKIDRKALPAANREITVEQGHIAPRTTIEIQLAQIWSFVMNIKQVGVRDNFFHLGGHSLLAIRLISEIAHHFQIKLPLATLFQSPTIEKLSYLLRSSAESLPWAALIPIKQPNVNRPSLFCIHPGGGTVFCYQDLVNCLSLEQPFYGIQSIYLNPQVQPHLSVEQMAKHYIKELQSVQPHGPYFLSGWSFGGLVAFEMAQQLTQQGEKIALLAILDTDPLMRQSQLLKSINKLGDVDLFLSKLEGFYGLSVDRLELQKLERDQQIFYLLEKSKQYNIFPEYFDIAELSLYLNVVQLNRQAAENYKPQYYPGSIILFQASETQENLASTWTQLVEKVETYIVPGKHGNMVKLPYVKILAQQLQKYLDTTHIPHFSS